MQDDLSQYKGRALTQAEGARLLILLEHANKLVEHLEMSNQHKDSMIDTLMTLNKSLRRCSEGVRESAEYLKAVY